ncbi:LysE/ArgO family amino acid transporter [Paraphotobacterium marinum]|uniref:LysE/ArgO family amino acid transporter n=1 Tax=Paraphotobacterium marinum TaxID=1755811 RepID=UPI0039E7F7C4
MNALISGLSTGLSLIVSIGAQNNYVLKKGLEKNNILLCVFVCITIDIFLITFGVLGFGELIKNSHIMLKIATYGGASFLFLYALLSFKSCFSSDRCLKQDKTKNKQSKKTIFITLLAFSLLNPHVYLDTVILIGSISTQFDSLNKIYFTLGTFIASILWFLSLGYLSRFLLPIFQKQISWKVLDFIIGCTMLYLSIKILN